MGLPLGNIEDISLRAIRSLKEASLIICEDTRVFYKLWQKLINLGHLQMPYGGRLMVINEFNEKSKFTEVVEAISLAGEALLVSDAGMPTVSDPGFRLVKEVIEREGRVEVIPGPTAAMTALSVSGFSSDRVLYLGFLPKRPSKRRDNWNLIKQREGLTVIFYESPTRVEKTLNEIESEFGPDVPTAIARELTKEHEQISRGKVSDLINQSKDLKGEVVILFRI